MGNYINRNYRYVGIATSLVVLISQYRALSGILAVCLDLAYRYLVDASDFSLKFYHNVLHQRACITHLNA